MCLGKPNTATIREDVKVLLSTSIAAVWTQHVQLHQASICTLIQVKPYPGTCLSAVWTLTALGYLLGLVMIWVPEAFTAMVSITSLGLYLSCERRASPHMSSSLFSTWPKTCADLSRAPAMTIVQNPLPIMTCL